MKKITKILIIASIFTLFSINILAANNPQHAITLSNQDEDSANQLSEPKVSAEGDVTSLWNYTFTGTGNSFQVEISGDGKYILGINNTCANIFHRNSNKSLWTYVAGNYIKEAAMSYNGRYIVLIDNNHDVTLLDSTSKTDLWHFNDASGCVDLYVDISEDGTKVAVANTSGGVFLFDNAASGGQKQPVWWHDDGTWYKDVAISGNGQYIVTGDNNDNIRLFNTTTTTPKTYEWQFDTTNNVKQVAISYTGDYFVALNNDDEVYLFNTTNPGGKPMWNFTTTEYIETMDISSYGNKIVVPTPSTLYYFNNSFQSGNKTAEWSYIITDNLNINDIEIAGGYKDIYYIGFGTYNPTFYLLNSTKTTPKLEVWKNPIDSIHYVDISALGDYFVFCSDVTDTLYLYHHDVPIPPALIPYLAGDDDDDDDDEPAIPYGNYYLGFAGLAIVALIVIMKRKALLRQKK
jgi:WD40 repeat protein